MKTLTTLTAIAALITGMSIASAQMSPSGSSGSNAPQQQASGNGKFCLEASSGGALNCKYASLAACQKDAKAPGQNCSPNPKSGTTGAR